MVKNEIPNYCVNVAYERPQRPISAVSWCPDGGSKIAIANISNNSNINNIFKVIIIK